MTEHVHRLAPDDLSFVPGPRRHDRYDELMRRARGLPPLSVAVVHPCSADALEAARRNLARMGTGIPLAFHWHDLAAEPVAARYDAIVMNPPFHQGRAAEPELGLRMIAAARAALKRGGRLFLVANRSLPYERALEAGFAGYGEITRDARYKVLWAER